MPESRITHIAFCDHGGGNVSFRVEREGGVVEWMEGSDVSVDADGDFNNFAVESTQVDD